MEYLKNTHSVVTKAKGFITSTGALFKIDDEHRAMLDDILAEIDQALTAIELADDLIGSYRDIINSKDRTLQYYREALEVANDESRESDSEG